MLIAHHEWIMPISTWPGWVLLVLLLNALLTLARWRRR